MTKIILSGLIKEKDGFTKKRVFITFLNAAISMRNPKKSDGAVLEISLRNLKDTKIFLNYFKNE